MFVCRPDRNARLDILNNLSEDAWQGAGISSSASSTQEFDLLWEALGKPELIGVGGMPGTTENWIAQHGGEFVT